MWSAPSKLETSGESLLKITFFKIKCLALEGHNAEHFMTYLSES